ncbi:hypothetical protein [Cellulomonas hominis]|uniref:hypothetical protein n=1 Tax=Cellulomonas hominis TaxID=156981 RepID=UPI001BCE8109|nr:hypothetical protein [Cellulomonas hominis]
MATTTAVVCALAAGAAGPAFAAMGRTGHGIEISGVTSYGTTWLGPVVGTADAEVTGWLSWCITIGPDAPDGAPAVAIDYVSDPQLAWIVQAKEGEARSDGSGLSAAAIAYLMHSRHDTGTATVSDTARRAALEANTPQSIKDKAAAYLGEAASQAGPYGAGNAAAVGAGERTGQVNNLGMQSDAGAWIPGKEMTVTLDGPAVFDTNGNGRPDPGETNVWTGQTEGGPISLRWAANGNGTVNWTRTIKAPARTTLTKFSAAGQVQDTLSYGYRSPSDPEEITAPGPAFDVVFDFQPVATSNVGDAKVVEAGEELSDTLTVSAKDDPWVVLGGDPVDVLFEGTAYATGLQPAAQAADVPADAPVVGTASFIADGPGEYTVTAPALPQGQFVTWVWREVKANQPANLQPYIRGDWSDAYGIAEETTSVRHDTVDFDSTLTVRETKSGTYLVDDVWTDGFPEDHTEFDGAAGFAADVKDMAHELWFFPQDVEVLDENIDQAELVGTVKLDAENGFEPTVGSTKYVVKKDEAGNDVVGTYAARVVWAGDDRVAPFTSSVTDPAEQYATLPVPLGVTTKAHSDVELVEGGTATLGDTGIVTGTVPEDSTIEYDLHHWTGEDPVCTPENLVDHSEAIPLDGPGEYESTPTVLDPVNAGSYGYVETVRNVDGQVIDRGECGEAEETLHVTPAPEPAAPLAGDEDAAAALADTDGALAVTGSQATAMAAAAAALVAAGVGVVLYRRRLAQAVAAQAGTDLP